MGHRFDTRAKRNNDAAYSYGVTCCVAFLQDKIWRVEAIFTRHGQAEEILSNTINANGEHEAKQQAVKQIKELLATPERLGHTKDIVLESLNWREI